MTDRSTVHDRPERDLIPAVRALLGELIPNVDWVSSRRLKARINAVAHALGDEAPFHFVRDAPDHPRHTRGTPRHPETPYRSVGSTVSSDPSQV